MQHPDRQERRIRLGLGEVVQGDVDGTIRLALSQGSLFDFDPAAARENFEEINLRKRRVRARTTTTRNGA